MPTGEDHEPATAPDVFSGSYARESESDSSGDQTAPPITSPDSLQQQTTLGLSQVPSISLLSVGRASWGAGFDRHHVHFFPSLVALHTRSGGGRLSFNKEDQLSEIEINGPSVVLFNDWYLERIYGVQDHWHIEWYEFTSSDPMDPLMMRVVPSKADEAELSKVRIVQQNLTSDQFSDRAYAAALFSEMLFNWFRAIGYQSTNRDHQLLEQATRILQKKIYERTNVEAVAEEIGVSPVKLRSMFRQYLLMSPKHYYDRLRMEEARRLLKKGLLAKQVGRRLGFQSSNHFSKFFKSQVGLSIREYRQRYCGSANDQ